MNSQNSSINLLRLVAPFILAFFWCHPAIYAKHPAHSADVNALLLQLDSLVADNNHIIEIKENRINFLRNEINKAATSREKFQLARNLYNEYQVFDSDSALYYANLSAKYLKDSGIDDYNLEAQVKIDQAFCQSVQGKFPAAKDIMASINPRLLNADILPLYYQAKEYIYSLESIYFNNFSEEKALALKSSNDFMDSIIKVAPTSKSLLWVPVALKVRKFDEGLIEPISGTDSDIVELQKVVDLPEEPSRTAATNAYWLACYYRSKGDKEMQVKYLTVAAIYDTLIANREISAIQELASVLFEDKEDIDRAFNYLNFALDEVSQYKNKAKIGDVSWIMNIVRNAYEEDIMQRDKRLHKTVVALVIVAGVFLIALFLIFWEYRKVNKLKSSLFDLNKSLTATVRDRDEAISSLKVANDELTEANARNVEILAFLYRLSINYLGSFDNFRKTLLVKFKGKKINEIETILNNDDIIKNQYETFYKNLDSTILAVFPNFIEDYNATAPSDQQLTEADLKNKSLNTRMRIFGLKKLGINKSSEIAQMLNISIRTVYNNR